MSFEPRIIKNLLEQKQLESFRARIALIKESGNYTHDNKYFMRDMLQNDPFFVKIHNLLMNPLAQTFFPVPVMPSHSFVLMYDGGKGNFNIHVDQSYCEWSLDVCVSQSHVWPIYINSKFVMPGEPGTVNFETYEQEEIEKLHREGTPYELSPGDALLFCGSTQPHWRKKNADGAFCDMVLFQFITKP